MKQLLITLALILTSCTGWLPATADVLAPPAVPNPYVIAGVPLCDETLSLDQHKRMLAALGVWNTAYPRLRLTLTRRCVPGQPEIKIDDSLDAKRCGYTTPDLRDGVSILFRTDQCMTPCVAVHEVGHYVGLFRHAPANEPGPMSDGDRGECLPSPQDVAILRRTYEGKLSL